MDPRGGMAVSHGPGQDGALGDKEGMTWLAGAAVSGHSGKSEKPRYKDAQRMQGRLGKVTVRGS